MSKIITPRLNPIMEFKHSFKMKKNRGYIINQVDKAVSRGQHSINIDPTKLEIKKYLGTECALLDRKGDSLKIKVDQINKGHGSITFSGYGDDINYTPYEVNTNIIGYSHPQHGDRFSKYEGRKNALLDALNQLELKSSQPDFEELLALKLVLRNHEMNSNVESISWEFFDLWMALQKHDSVDVSIPAKALVGEDNFDLFFEHALGYLLLEDVSTYYNEVKRVVRTFFRDINTLTLQTPKVVISV